MDTAEEIGWKVGQALKHRQFKKAIAITENGVLALSAYETVHDYRMPLSEVCPNARIVACFESIQVMTVEDFYRNHPRALLASAEHNFSSKQDLEDQMAVVENKYSARLHGKLHPPTIAALHAANILTVEDVRNTSGKRLGEIVTDHDARRKLALMQRGDA